MQFSAKTVFLTVSFLCVTACSETDTANTVVEANLPILTIEDLGALYISGRNDDLIAAVKRKEQAGVAQDEDFILSTRAHHALLDSIGASIDLDKVAEEYRSRDEYAILRARTQLMEGQLARAVDTLTAHTFTEGFYEAALMQGDIAFLRDAYIDAAAHYSAAIEQDGQNYRAYVGRAQTYLKAGNLQSALDDAETAVSQTPENTLTRYTLGTVYNQMGQQAAAKAQFEQSLTYFDKNIPSLLELVGILIVEGNFDVAEGYLDRVYSEQPENSTAQFFSAMMLAVKGDDESARDQLELLVINNNTSPQIARLLGHVAYRLKEYEAARSRLEMAIEKAPFDRVSRIALADIYLQQDNPKHALTTLEPMIEEGSNDIAALSMASLAAAKQNDLPRAIDYTARTIKLAESPDTVLDKAVIASQIKPEQITIFKRRLASYYAGAGQSKQASDILNALIAEDSADIDSILLLSNMQTQNGDFAAAIAAAERMIKQNSKAAVGYNALGTAHHRQGDLVKALVAYDKAIALNGAYVSALKNRGALYLTQQKYTAARNDLNAVLNVTPKDAHAQLMYVRALIETGGATEALGYFSSLESVFPQSVPVFMHHARAFAANGDYQSAVSRLEIAQSLSDAATKVYLDELMTQYQDVLERQRAARRPSLAATPAETDKPKDLEPEKPDASAGPSKDEKLMDTAPSDL